MKRFLPAILIYFDPRCVIVVASSLEFIIPAHLPLATRSSSYNETDRPTRRTQTKLGTKNSQQERKSVEGRRQRELVGSSAGV